MHAHYRVHFPDLVLNLLRAETVASVMCTDKQSSMGGCAAAGSYDPQLQMLSLPVVSHTADHTTTYQ